MIDRASERETRGRSNGATEHRVKPRSKSRSRNEGKPEPKNNPSSVSNQQEPKRTRESMHFQQEKERKRVWNKRGNAKSKCPCPCPSRRMNPRPQNKKTRREMKQRQGADKAQKYMKPRLPTEQFRRIYPEKTPIASAKKGGETLTKFALVAVSYPISAPAPRVLLYSGKRSDHTWH